MLNAGEASLIAVRVLALVEDLDLIRPARPAGSSPWPLLAGTLVLLLLAVWWIQRGRPPVAVPRGRPPHVIALEELALARSLMASPDPLPFVVAVSGTVRRYIEGRFGVRAPAMTTMEFLRAAGLSASWLGAHRGALGAFLETCDLTKFAEHRPARGHLPRLLETAEDFVRRTAAVEAPPSTVAAQVV
jgi:hypothetical protein